MSGGASTLLDAIEDIDARWIDAVLAGAAVPARVASVEAAPIGNGTTSIVARLRITYADAGADTPATLVAKFPRPRTTRSTAPVVVEGFAREIAAYKAFGAAPPCRIPRCYHAEMAGDGLFTLVLEDLDEGCRPGDQVAGCSIRQADAVVHELAGLHAAWWRDRRLDALDWPRRRAPIAARAAALYAAGARIMRERFAGLLPDTTFATIDAATPLFEQWYATPPVAPTLVHTDPRVDNVIFEDRADGIRACLIDLQSVAIGDAANDVAYFLTGSLTADDRAACERDAVSRHAARVRAAGIDYPDDLAWERYRRYAIAGMAGTVMAAPLIPAGGHADALLLALIRRNCAAVDTLDGIAAAHRHIAVA